MVRPAALSVNQTVNLALGPQIIVETTSVARPRTSTVAVKTARSVVTAFRVQAKVVTMGTRIWRLAATVKKVVKSATPAARRFQEPQPIVAMTTVRMGLKRCLLALRIAKGAVVMDSAILRRT
jgi:hypothetical protein